MNARPTIAPASARCLVLPEAMAFCVKNAEATKPEENDDGDDDGDDGESEPPDTSEHTR